MTRLVLTRNVGERVQIKLGDHELWVNVKEIRGRAVRLSFEGSTKFKILREELVDK